MRLRQPQAPGYILYIMVLRLIRWLTGAPDVQCLVTASILATVLSAVLFYRLVLRWTTPPVAVLLSLLLVTSPVVWFNAEVTMSYPFGLLAGVAVALAAIGTIDGARGPGLLLPIAWGLAAGFRQDAGMLLTPLVLYAAFRQFRRSRRYGISFALLWVATVSCWLIPLVASAGGLTAYRALLAQKIGVQAIALTLLRHGQVHEFLLHQRQVALVVTAWVALGALSAVALLAVRALPRVAAAIGRPDPAFLLLWGGGGLLFHTLAASPGHSGYVLPYLPAVALLPLAFRREPPAAARPAPAWVLPTVLAGGIALQSAFFLLAPQGRAFSGHWRTDTLIRSVMGEPTRSRIALYDATVQELVRVIPTRFRPDNTLLLVAAGAERPWYPPIRHMPILARYYLPHWEQRVLLAGSGEAVAEVGVDRFVIRRTRIVEVPRGTRWLVWFGDPVAQPYGFEGAWTREPIGEGIDLLYAAVDSLAPERWHWGPFAIESRP